MACIEPNDRYHTKPMEFHRLKLYKIIMTNSIRFQFVFGMIASARTSSTKSIITKLDEQSKKPQTRNNMCFVDVINQWRRAYSNKLFDSIVNFVVEFYRSSANRRHNDTTESDDRCVKPWFFFVFCSSVGQTINSFPRTNFSFSFSFSRRNKTENDKRRIALCQTNREQAAKV